MDFQRLRFEATNHSSYACHYPFSLSLTPMGQETSLRVGHSSVSGQASIGASNLTMCWRLRLSSIALGNEDESLAKAGLSLTALGRDSTRDRLTRKLKHVDIRTETGVTVSSTQRELEY